MRKGKNGRKRLKATVDISFKKIFGSAENPIPALNLLQAVLKEKIASLEFLNPYNLQETEGLNFRFSILRPA